jgi:branched-chain amino acid transport system ATP-binding protein
VTEPPLLSVDRATKRFGGVVALDGVSFDVPAGETLGIIGPNGAGKTTLLNCISRVYSVDDGEIRFAGLSLAPLRPAAVARLGIGRTFQVVRPFSSMTVRENVAVGALFGSDRARMGLREAFVWADEVLELVGLHAKRARVVTELTVPDRKRLEVARALATKPRLLLLDEVMAGLNATEVDQALDVVRRVRAMAVTVVLIEHVMRVILGICDRVLVLHLGRRLAEGRPDAVLRDSAVIEAYLGERYARRRGPPA